jgi:hypothetical protein
MCVKRHRLSCTLAHSRYSQQRGHRCDTCDRLSWIIASNARKRYIVDPNCVVLISPPCSVEVVFTNVAHPEDTSGGLWVHYSGIVCVRAESDDREGHREYDLVFELDNQIAIILYTRRAD